MDKIAKLCADLAAAGFIEPPTPALTPEAGTDPPGGGRKALEEIRAGILVQEEAPRAG